MCSLILILVCFLKVVIPVPRGVCPCLSPFNCVLWWSLRRDTRAPPICPSRVHHASSNYPWSISCVFLLLLESRPTCAGRALIPRHPRAFLKLRAVLTSFSISRTSYHAWYLTRNSVLSEWQTPSACPVPSIRMLGLYCRDEKNSDHKSLELSRRICFLDLLLCRVIDGSRHTSQAE